MRFTPHTSEDRAAMLAALGLGSVDELFEVIPEPLRARSWDLPPGMSEPEVSQYLAKLAGLNAQDLVCFLGGGFYDHYIPAAVDALISRGEFYTAYTPYQAEMSQGILQSIFEYQSAICRLTGLDAANASLYDGGTALYEAAMMAVRKTKRKKLIVCTSVSPIYRIMLRTYTINLHLELVEADVSDPAVLQGLLDQDTAGLILQNPDFFGVLHDYAPHFAAVRELKGLGILGCNPIALAVAKTPAQMGADIAVGEGQPLGLPLSFGGPYLGFMAVSQALLRTMPGRIVGRTHDGQGRVGYCLTLQTREQHIRREKATSNICSNEALCALAAVIFLGLMGKQGLVELAELNMTQAAYARERLCAIDGVEPVDQGPWFNEFRVRLPIDARVAVSRMIDKGIAAGFPLGRYYPEQSNNLLVAVTEKRSKEEIGYLAEGLEAVL
ncbi:MAG: aminomethyl-transferring glycine dehydrogenase subunit GcvPA [Desulfarculaceae bacterium]|nr:aminomethyl-transferring glycine dehydrogenase subunit GcvPA [Desulfarculaceae bacterium]MCF8047896.1 aminomethyl-transferring glycine dehydrogenase subunit GcvPA [Desulfarculaceae bacterium]MCF8066199.1 aminomethyl-transferring glycine dehydrogenase subunit GcvPA [Desulfarculaceae bacterium]MCF8099049.1 aminomethyl-transferring glycine dehydrogenase subunit GcvPA [Desulfarculaceae bacterium]MCF8122483.1 aminomethyl-transferring glycine dehydrogenase subunit GcvPA [Desulfarculaceae bacterium